MKSLFVMVGGLLCTIMFAVQVVDAAPSTTKAEVRTTGVGLTSKVAPGEFLHIAMKLLNFGSSKRVDVNVLYEVSDILGHQIYVANETVAVETTASFVKVIQIPFETHPGRYIAKSSVTYKDQQVPATSHFSFFVERKIAGLFESEFYVYGGITLMISLMTGVIGYIFIRRRTRVAGTFDYSNIPRDKRVYYELIGDTITRMRRHAGDQALDIARSIDGLVIDKNTGRVLDIHERPSHVMARLLVQYEKRLGQKMSFHVRKQDRVPIGHARSNLDKNIILIKKV